ncbi:MAG: T9SS type B sorting domain-containing protein [Saprospiraceae bacterium]|nr:T9SS type B sorting domain-containing protein [Saprospiraceae bacterium]
MYHIKVNYKEPKIWIPNVISTNGDNINDELEIKGEFFEPVELAIYDRWGSKLFYSNSNFKWDGKFNNEFVSIGVYIVHFTYLNQQTGELKSFTQDLTVVR